MIRLALLTFLFSGLLSACGQKGPLFLPQPTTPDEQAVEPGHPHQSSKDHS
ncbi:MAG: lipoprotein [SAR86 cluster bacterium]